MIEFKKPFEIFRVNADATFELGKGVDPLVALEQLAKAFMKQQDRIKRLEELGKELRECASMIGTHYSNQIETIDQAEAAVEAWDKEAKP